ncbi:hypothetical protein G6L33_15670 [Agrobacterium rhizogenes]|nr:hypothetical protein [Rhizobium rhizogenes]
METDTNFWFGVAGMTSGLVGILVAIVAVAYGRRQALAAEGPSSPDLEVISHGWLSGSDEWYSIDIMMKNRTDRFWEMSSARLALPVGGRLVTSQLVLVEDGAGNYVAPPVSELSADELTNVTSPVSAVAPVGTSSQFRFWGESDGCREVFFAYIPPRLRAASISIEFTLEDRALNARQIRKTLNRRLNPRTSNATV